MRRPQLFEFLDLPGYPSALRELQTDAIGHLTGSAFEAAAPLIADMLRRTGVSHVIDLCSGAGGPWLGLYRILGDVVPAVTVTLTDQYPNIARFERVRAKSSGRIDFVATSLDARAVEPNLVGMRTMFSAFHHFPPDDALALLRNASDAGASIGVFDVTSARTNPRSMLQTIAFLAVAPLLFLLTYVALTPRLGPITWQRVVFTYLIPIMPVLTWWDFMVTAWRAYTLDEMNEMARSVQREGYVWEVGQLKTEQFPINYILGYPSKQTDAVEST